MKTDRQLFRLFSIFVFFAVTLLLSGCFTETTTTAVAFSNATINGHPARVELDTGEPASAKLAYAAANDLGFDVVPPAEGVKLGSLLGLSSPIQLTLGTETINLQIEVVEDITTKGLLLGWPIIQDNILLFDGDKRMISKISALPADIESWHKFKLVDVGNGLTFELPLPNGGIGTVLIDTGDPRGVTLPQTQWMEWQAENPKADMTTLAAGGVGGNKKFKIAWADQVHLGPITFTNVPVANITADESSDIDNFAGSLGLNALDRMDLIADAKSGWVYLRPRPPEPAEEVAIEKSAFAENSIKALDAKGDWVVADNVQLDVDAFVLAVAQYKNNIGDFDGAIAECKHVLEHNPKNVKGYLLQAMAQQNKGDYDSAIKNCDSALAIDPQNSHAPEIRAMVVESKAGAIAASSTTNQTDGLDPKTPALGLIGIISAAKRMPTEMSNADYDAAIADLNSLIVSVPDSDDNLYAMRGLAWEEKGDDVKGMADFNRSIQAGPADGLGYFFRACSWKIRGDFAHALVDYNEAVQKAKEQDNSYESRLFRELLLRQLNRPPTKNFAQTVESWEDAWDKALGQFVAGKIDEAALLAAAEKKPSDSDPDAIQDQKSTTYYFIGAMRLLNGDSQGARDFLQKSMDADPKKGFPNYQLAQADLARLDAAQKK